MAGERGSGFDRVAVLIPCYNEAPTVGAVVRDFRAALGGSVVYAFDKNSTAFPSTGLMLAGILCFAAGLILDTVSRGRRESKLLAYLQHSAVKQ
jgi:hypothetical protein